MIVDTILFDDALHEYRTPDGRRIPSVTEILRSTGVSVDFEKMSSLSERIGVAIEEKRALGSALHKDAWAFDDDDLDWSTVDPRVEPYLRAWETFRANSALVPLTRERRVFHAGLFYGGTLDGLFRSAEGLTVLIDLKTGDPEDAGARYQLAGYQLAYEEDHPATAIDLRWSVRLTPDRAVPYRITPYTDFRDFGTWRAIVSTYWAAARRRPA